MDRCGFGTEDEAQMVIQQARIGRNLGGVGDQRSLASALSLNLSFNLLRASPLLSQLSGSDPRSVGAVVGMVGTGVLGEVMGRPDELSGVKGYSGLLWSEDEECKGVGLRWAGKCFPRWADLDQASSGEPEPPEEVES